MLIIIAHVCPYVSLTIKVNHVNFTLQLILLFQTLALTMWTKRFVLDPTDDWGKIPSQLLDRGSFFSTPDPSEEGLQVDEEYEVENVWETDSPEHENVQENGTD